MIDKQKVIRHLISEMEDPFRKEIAKKFKSWIDEDKIGAVGEFFLYLLEQAEKGKFSKEEK